MQDTKERPDTAMQGSGLWNKVLGAALALPGAKVDRDSFLRKELRVCCSEDMVEKAIAESPANAGISPETIDRLADAQIKYHKILASIASGAAGLPGGPVVWGALPADLAQFYYHAIVLSQKLVYLYGYPSLLDDDEIDTETKYRISMLIGIMTGAKKAAIVMNRLSRETAKQVLRRLPRQALTKIIPRYFAIRQVLKWLGIHMKKNTIGRGASRVIPILGGLTAATMTMVMMGSMAKKLKRHLKKSVFARPRVINDVLEVSNV